MRLIIYLTEVKFTTEGRERLDSNKNYNLACLLNTEDVNKLKWRHCRFPDFCLHKIWSETLFWHMQTKKV